MTSVYLQPTPTTAEVMQQIPEAPIEEAQFTTSLAAHIKNAWHIARTAKQPVTERLLKCERQRRGVYDPDRAMEIQKTGGSDIFMMITDIKARAARSWIKDILNSAYGRPFDLEPAKEPHIPPEISASISDMALMEMNNVLMEGAKIHPEALRLRMAMLHDEVRLRIREEAKESARRHTMVIEDQLKEGNFDPEFDEFIEDFVTYPTAILKAPTIKRKRKLTWGNDFEPIIISDITRAVERVSPYDMYPAPNSNGPNDSYLLERHRLVRADLEDMMGIPGNSDRDIRMAIDQYGNTGYRYMELGDQQRNLLSGKFNTYLWRGEIIETLEYWGKVQGTSLMEWGMRDKRIEPYRDYEVNAWIVGNYVIRCVLNPDPLGRRPYSTASWGLIPKAFWGMALPEIVRDVQTMCNAAARSLANNMAVASGPQVEVQIDRLPDGEDITAVYPWKIWQTTSDRTGSGQPAIRFFQPTMNASDLMGIYQTFMRQADEVTGIPNYVYGSTAQGGAGRTASGLSMLMDNAAKGIKDAIVQIDKTVSGIVSRYYTHNMMYHPDRYIKGDFKVVTRGALGLIAREHLQAKRNEFLAATANPIDMQIIGNEGRAHLLREAAQGLNLNTDKIVPDDEKLKMLGGPNLDPKQVEAQMQELAGQVEQAQQLVAEREQQIQQLMQQLSGKEQEVEVKRYEVDRKAEIGRYEADRRAEIERYKTDVQADVERNAALQQANTQVVIAEKTAAKEAEKPEKEGEAKEEPLDLEKLAMLLKESQSPPIIINDTSSIGEALKGQAESTKILADKLSAAQEALAKAIEKSGKKSTITLKRGPDGSISGTKE